MTKQQIIYDLLVEQQVIPEPCTYWQLDEFMKGLLWALAGKIVEACDKADKEE